jgi:N-acetyl-D-muramate 6-phosphate phosphatase
VSTQTPLQAVLFDLDGTLVDTAPDMTAALNRLRIEHGQEALPFERLRPYVSRGSNGLLSVGFGDGQTAPERAALVERFLALYSADLCNDSKPFAGIAAVLDWIEQRGLPWGIVTNKPGWLARPLLERLALTGRAGCLVSGDCLPERKPHPRPLLHAAEQIGRAPAACVYVGDDLRDVQAGQAAGMQTVVARWGYIPPDQEPRDWNAEVYLDNPAALLTWLRAQTLAKP